MTHWQIGKEGKLDQKLCSFHDGEKQVNSLFNHTEGNVQKACSYHDQEHKGFKVE